MSTPLRFAVWLLSTLPVMFAVGALGYLPPASGIKFDLNLAFQMAGNLVLGWFFGLIRAQKIATSIVTIIFALLMPAILVVLAIASTLFCGIGACGHYRH